MTVSDVCISRGCSVCLSAAANRQLKLGTAESRFVSRKKSVAVSMPAPEASSQESLPKHSAREMGILGTGIAD